MKTIIVNAVLSVRFTIWPFAVVLIRAATQGAFRLIDGGCQVMDQHPTPLTL